MQPKPTVVSAVGGLILIVAMFVGDPASDLTNSAVIQWLRVIGGTVGMIVGGMGVWALYRVSLRTKSVEALEKTVDIYKDQNIALTTRVDQLMRDHALTVQTLTQRDVEVKELRTKTDVSQILVAQQELLNIKRDHDQQMLTALRDLSERGNKQYTDAMSVLTKTLDYLSDFARKGDERVTMNHELLVTVVNAIGRIADKVQNLEVTVKDTRSLVQETKNAVEDPGDSDGRSEPEPEPRRRDNTRRR